MLDFLKIDPVAFTIPIGDGFAIYWYGIIITIGIAIGAWWGGREIERRGQNVDEFFNGLMVLVISGYIFARLTYVLLDFLGGRGAQYETLLDVLNVRAGGVNILGGFIGAGVVGLFFVRWRKIPFWHYADVAGVTLLIAQAIGRWGNFINQELYGPPTTLPWGIKIDAAHRIFKYADTTVFPLETRFHPTFLYESIWLLLGFGLLVWLNRRYYDQWKVGTLFAIFLIWWGGGRVWVEFFRPDQLTIGDNFVTYSMLMAFILAVVGIYLLLRLNEQLPVALQSRQRRRALRPKRNRTNE